jgi:hypothetical protein
VRARDGVINISGVDFWHAVEFSRNGSFLHGRFTGPSGLSLRCVPTLSEDFPSELPPAFGDTFAPYEISPDSGLWCRRPATWQGSALFRAGNPSS